MTPEYLVRLHSGNWGATRESRDAQGKSLMDIIRQDLKDMDITWDEAEELATDRAEWRQRVAQCTHLGAG